MSLSNRAKGSNKETMPKDIDVSSIQYVKAKDLVGKIGEPIQLMGFFYTNGKFGASVTLVGVINGSVTGINLPNWYIKTFKDLTDEEIDEILEGKQALASVEAFETKNGNDSYKLYIIDVE